MTMKTQHPKLRQARKPVLAVKFTHTRTGKGLR